MIEPTADSVIAGAISAGHAWRRPLILFPLVTAIVLNIASWLMLYLGIPQTDELVVLHYNIFFGVDLLDTWIKLFYVPGSGLAILLVNGGLAWAIIKRNVFLARMALWASAVLQAIALVAVILLVLVN